MMFEAKNRDGLARTGIFRDGVELVLPAVMDVDRIFPDLGKACQNNVPLSADFTFVKKYFQSGDMHPVPVHPGGSFASDSGDSVMVANWHTALANPRNYVKWLISLKDQLPPDTMWYAPAAALPSNIHLLCYSGFDLFDFRGVDLKSMQGIFCLPEGEFSEDEMDSGICSCTGCRQNDLSEHNRQALIREIALASRFISQGRLRELVESRCRMHAEQVAILRHLDSQYPFMERWLPAVRSTPLIATTGESINRAEVKRFAERVIERYLPPDAEVAVLLPCSARKPYSLSQSHRQLARAIGGRAHELIVTSPLGLVPRELELVYPAAHYDVPVTGYWDREECSIIADIIARYFKKHRYSRVIAHLEGGALKVAEIAAELSGIELECTCRERPLAATSLSALDEALMGGKRVLHDLVHGTASWQFGTDIDTGGLHIRGRYPRLSISRNKKPFFSIDTATGLLRPTFAGWGLIDSVYRVTIDSFTPKGDILAPGVIKADPGIRVGDEVLVEGPMAVATGRAAMGAWEMSRSKRGVAVKVRKVNRLEMQ